VSTSPRYVSDLIVDLLVEAGIEHAAFNPGASFRGIHDSLVNHRADAPQVVLCAHEGIAVTAAQAYAKASGKPMAALVHDLVGLQHASMAIYNAWCDRAPVLALGGSGPHSKSQRRPWIDWIHTAADEADLIRDYVKWDDEPRDADSVTESFARAYLSAIADPPGPVFLSYDLELQERELPPGFERDPLDRYQRAAPPAPGGADLGRLGDALVGAALPVIVAGYLDSDFAGLTDLADLLAAPVVDAGVRLAFPTSHELNATGVDELFEEADVVLALDLDDPRGTLGEELLSRAKVLEVGLSDLRLRGWANDYQPLAPSAERITASGEAAVAGLVERLRERPPDNEAVTARREQMAQRVKGRREDWAKSAAAASADGAVPLERLVYELGAALAGERYVLANGTNGRLEHRCWALDRPRQYLGWHGGGGLGYGLGAAIGASLAAGPETISVDVQADGDLLYTPAALWTMAHLGLPVLVVVANNRQYANTVEHAEALARERDRPPENRHIGAGLTDPPVDFAALARAFGVWAAGPVAEPEALKSALAEAIAVARDRRPALVEVLTPQL
jgi:acetolactate synthase-1/2/3 large subunit